MLGVFVCVCVYSCVEDSVYLINILSYGSCNHLYLFCAYVLVLVFVCFGCEGVSYFFVCLFVFVYNLNFEYLFAFYQWQIALNLFLGLFSVIK